MPGWLDELIRRVTRLEIEEAALSKETDAPTRNGWRSAARGSPI